MYAHTVGSKRYHFRDLRTLLAKATPARSGDALAGLAAESAEERVAAQMALSDLPLGTFLSEAVIPYEADEITRLILDTHDAAAFHPISHLTVGSFREWLLSHEVTSEVLARVAPAITPEMAAAVSKLMRLQDLALVARKCRVVTRFRNTLGLPGRLSTRLQPNHPTDDPRGIGVSIIDGLLYGCGDAVIGINPATDSPQTVTMLLEMVDAMRQRYAIPTQSCVLAHVTTTIQAMNRGAPVDLVFQSIAGTEAANTSFGVTLSLLADAVARRFHPLLVNTVVGFIGPEYLYDGKQILRAGLEDHFCGKLLGLPMGCDVCYTNHAEADQDDMDALLTVLGVAGCTYIMGVPGADDVMLGYQSTSFHDALYLPETLGLRPAPEFEAWLQAMGVMDEDNRLLPPKERALQLAAAVIPGR